MSDDLIIIGAGPAGLTAALYAGRAGLKTVVLERGMPGGLAASTDLIENFPGFPGGIKGVELGELFARQAERFGGRILRAEASAIRRLERVFEVITDEGSFTSRSVIIASGSHPNQIGVPGEDRLRGRGVSYCATCDGPFYRDQEVVVVGCGNSGLQEGRYLLRFARRVTFIEILSRIPAETVLRAPLEKDPRVRFLLNHRVIEIQGKETVEAITVLDQSNGQKKIITVAGVFIYAGYKPNSDFAADFLARDRLGGIVTDSRFQTSQDGVFACGDIRGSHIRQVVTACAEGAQAAIYANEYIESLDSS